MKWTIEEKSILARMYREKKSYGDIAIALNRSLKSVSCMIETLHRGDLLEYNRDHERYSKNEIEKMLDMSLAGCSQGEIAFKLGRSVDSVKMKLFFFREKLKRR